MQLENNKLWIEGFLRLNELELQDEESDEEEFWLTLSSWGFNRALQQDEVLPQQTSFARRRHYSSYISYIYIQGCGFRLEVFAQDCNVDLKALEVSNHRRVLDEALLEVVRGKGDKRKVEGAKNVNILTYETKFKCTVAVENKVIIYTSL